MWVLTDMPSEKYRALGIAKLAVHDSDVNFIPIVATAAATISIQ